MALCGGAVQEVANGLAAIYQSAKGGEGVQSAAMSSLARVLRTNSGLAPMVLERLGLRTLLAGAGGEARPGDPEGGGECPFRGGAAPV